MEINPETTVASLESLKKQVEEDVRYCEERMIGLERDKEYCEKRLKDLKQWLKSLDEVLR
jgi:chaperonin cofactor prefoldin